MRRFLVAAGTITLVGLGAIPVNASTISVSSYQHESADQTIPMSCSTVGTASDSNISILLGLLGIVVAPYSRVGLNCTPVPNGDPRVNFCAQNNYNGLLAIGQDPNGHTCP